MENNFTPSSRSRLESSNEEVSWFSDLYYFSKANQMTQVKKSGLCQTVSYS